MELNSLAVSMSFSFEVTKLDRIMFWSNTSLFLDVMLPVRERACAILSTMVVCRVQLDPLVG